MPVLLATESRARIAIPIGFTGLVCGLALADGYAGSGWFLDSPFMVLLAALAGYLLGAWTPARVALAGASAGAVVLALASQRVQDPYAFLDDLTFFAVAVGGPALAGAAVLARARQLRDVTRLQAELVGQRTNEELAARLEEQTRLQHQVHRGLGERVAAIALRAEGAERASATHERLAVLEELESAARATLDDLRTALGWLREPTTEPPPPAPPAPPRDRPTLTVGDGLVAAGVGSAIAAETLLRETTRGLSWVNVVAALLLAAPLGLRRQAPVLAVVAIVLAGTATSHWLTPVLTMVTPVLLLIVTGYALGAWARGWWWLPGSLLLCGGLVAILLTSPTDAQDPGALLPTLITSGLAVAAGRLTGSWQLRAERMTAALAELEHTRAAQLRLAVARERQAVASSLHDSVAHAMTVVCLQASAARHQPDPAVVTDVLHTVSRTARAGLAELRTGLGSLDGEPARLEAADVAALARRTRVAVDIDAPDGVLARGPAAVLGLRMLREALVNAARHAPGAPTRVVMSTGAGTLHLEVTDAGADADPYAAGSGAGLAGLAEALAEAGGSLSWSRLADGGFRVRADIPQDDRDRALVDT